MQQISPRFKNWKLNTWWVTTYAFPKGCLPQTRQDGSACPRRALMLLLENAANPQVFSHLPRPNLRQHS